MGKFIELPGVTRHGMKSRETATHCFSCMRCFAATRHGERSDPTFRLRTKYFCRNGGHMATPATLRGRSPYHDMASDTIDFLTMAVAKPAHLVGFSDGAIVALLVAIARPDLVRKLVGLAAISTFRDISPRLTQCSTA